MGSRELSDSVNIETVVALILIIGFIFIGIFAYWAYLNLKATRPVSAVEESGSNANILLGAAGLSWAGSFIVLIDWIICVTAKKDVGSAKKSIKASLAMKFIYMLAALVVLILVSIALGRLQALNGNDAGGLVAGAEALTNNYIVIALILSTFTFLLTIVTLVSAFKYVKHLKHGGVTGEMIEKLSSTLESSGPSRIPSRVTRTRVTTLEE